MALAEREAFSSISKNEEAGHDDFRYLAILT
jgi:hypothetical protein